MADEEIWKRRFLLFSVIRLFGLAMIGLGVAIAYSELLREGGWPLVGGLIAIAGVIDAVFAPRLLKKAWEEQDRQQR